MNYNEAVIVMEDAVVILKVHELVSLTENDAYDGMKTMLRDSYRKQ